LIRCPSRLVCRRSSRLIKTPGREGGDDDDEYDDDNEYDDNDDDDDDDDDSWSTGLTV